MIPARNSLQERKHYDHLMATMCTHFVPSVHSKEDLVASVNLGPEYLYSRSGEDVLSSLSYIKLSVQSYVFT